MTAHDFMHDELVRYDGRFWLITKIWSTGKVDLILAEGLAADAHEMSTTIDVLEHVR